MEPLTIDDVLSALDSYTEAKIEHDTGRDNYDGYSWGYWGHALIERMNKYKKEFGETLDKYIDQRIERKLNVST
jgi:hypothetical protein